MASTDTNELPYIPLAPYNGTGTTGGDSLIDNFNIWYQVSWQMPSSCSDLDEQEVLMPPQRCSLVILPL